MNFIFICYLRSRVFISEIYVLVLINKISLQLLLLLLLLLFLKIW